MEDSKIIELYIKRSENAIKETDIKYGNYCKTIANNIVCDLSDAEECVNDTYLKTWNTIPPTIPEWFKAYIGKISRNLALCKYRDKNRKKRGGGNIELVFEELEDCIPEASNVEVIMENKRILSVVNDFLDSLPEESRNIFVNRYWCTYSISELSTYYAMSESKIKSLLFRLRGKLKEKLKEEEIYI